MSKANELLELIESTVDLSDFEGDPDDVEGLEYCDGDVTDEELTADLLDGDFILEDLMDEARKVRILRVRGGKVQRISKVICPPGFRAVGDKCVKMSAREKAARVRAAKKASKKAHTAGAARKRLLSIRKAQALK